MKKECIAMLLAGGQGSRLYVLTGDMAKPAVPFGGKYQLTPAQAMAALFPVEPNQETNQASVMATTLGEQ